VRPRGLPDAADLATDNDHLIELLALADACRRAGAARIIAIVPFFGYGRADRRHGRRELIMARVIADLLEVVGIDRVVTVDPHTAVCAEN
jgi:ribose-phosphate pyrophosphokinase